MRIKGVKELSEKRKKQVAKLEGKTGDDPMLRAANLAMLHVQGYVQRSKLTGGTPIWVRTGRLRSSIRGRAKRVKQAKTVIQGSVGTNVVYAPVLEFGFKGAQKVKAHTRKGSKVRGHVRNVTRKAKPWLNPAFEEKREAINRFLQRGYREVFK